MPDIAALKHAGQELGLPEIPSLVPGHAVLGKGFNIFGRYNAASAKATLFDMTQPALRAWRSPQSGMLYILPQNVDDPVELGVQSGESTTFNSKSSVSQYFSAQANVSGKYGMFSAEFDAAFSSVGQQIADYYLGLVCVRSKNYKLRLLDASIDKLAPWVLDDPDFRGLPAEYKPSDPENVRAFFAFFNKFGTHFVNEVDMGGRLDYYTAIDKSYSKSETDFKAKLKLEAKAVFFAAKAEGSVAWNQLGEDWASKRIVRISATGSNTILDALVPGFNDNFHWIYNQWLVDLRFMPMPVDFSLVPIHSLFSGAQAQALKEATEAYAGNSLTLYTPDDYDVYDRSSGFANLNDKPLAPAPSLGSPGVRALVLDRSTLAVKVDKVYRITQHSIDPETLKEYAAVVADLDPYQGNRNVIVAILIWWVSGVQLYPSVPLANLLKNLGAGDAMDTWWSLKHTSSALGLVSYGIVGTYGGSAPALEAFAMHDSTATRGLLLEAFLKPEYSGGVFRYVPS